MANEHEESQAASTDVEASGVAITRLTVLSWTIPLLCALGLAVFSESLALRVTGLVLMAAFAVLILVAVRKRK